MAKNKKYTDIHIRPIGNGHVVKVHRPMEMKEGGMPSSMNDHDADDERSFPTHEEAGDYAKQVMATHDGKGGGAAPAVVEDMPKGSRVPKEHPLHTMRRMQNF